MSFTLYQHYYPVWPCFPRHRLVRFSTLLSIRHLPWPGLASHTNLPQLQIELNTHIAGQVITLTLVRRMENSLSSLLINSYVMLGMSYVCISGLLDDFSISLRRNFWWIVLSRYNFLFSWSNSIQISPQDCLSRFMRDIQGEKFKAQNFSTSETPNMVLGQTRWRRWKVTLGF